MLVSGQGCFFSACSSRLVSGRATCNMLLVHADPRAGLLLQRSQQQVGLRELATCWYEGRAASTALKAAVWYQGLAHVCIRAGLLLQHSQQQVGIRACSRLVSGQGCCCSAHSNRLVPGQEWGLATTLY